MAYVVGALLVVFLAVLSIKEIKSIGYVGKSEQVLNTISVDGKGEKASIPDIATFSFTVTETAKTVAEAQDKATAKTDAALKAIKDGGVADKDIKTLSYNINPHYEYQNSVCTQYSCPPSKSILTGYEVSQAVEVKVRDLSKAGTLFSLIGNESVQNIQGLNFTVDDIEKAKSEARALAIADAKTKANNIARDLGVRLVRITNFSDSTNYPMPYYARGVAMDLSAKNQAAPVAPSIPAGEQEITSNVTITYEIK